MSALTLRLKKGLRERVDVSSLVPERLAGLSARAVATLPLQAGNARATVGELFDIAAGRDPDALVLRASTAKLLGIGAGMTRGRIEVIGDAGAELGRAMRGGGIIVRGNAGAGAGLGMRGGRIDILGDAGDFLGGALPGAMDGMNEGRIHVRGSAGARVGDRQRRGLIVIEGDAGDHCGSRMRAGTIIVLGRAGRGIGDGMRRGTLVLRHRPRYVSALFNSSGVLEMDFLRLLFGSLRDEGRRFAALARRAPRAERLVGDLANGGKGEILLLAGSD